MKCNLLIISLFLSVFANGQQDSSGFILQGELKSSSRHEAIPFATVMLAKSKRAVVANDKGQFELFVPGKFRQDTLLVQAIGFQNYSAPLSHLSKINSNIIILKDTVYIMPEVTVLNISAKDLVLKSLGHYDGTMANEPYQMDCFYRNTIKENGTYVKLLESLFTMFDRGFNYKKIASAVEIGDEFTRLSNDYTNPGARLPYPLFRPQWLLTSTNYARDKKTIQNNIRDSVYEFEFQNSKYLNGKLIYIIKAIARDEVQKFTFDMTFYIQEKSYAIVQMDFDAKRKLKYQESRGIPHHLRLDVTDFKGTYVFQEHENKMYMQFLHNYAAYTWYASASGDLLTECEENSEAILANIINLKDDQPVFAPSGSRKKSGLSPTNYANDEQYWKTNELVSQIPLDPKVIHDLEKEIPLDAQFRKNK